MVYGAKSKQLLLGWRAAFTACVLLSLFWMEAATTAPHPSLAAPASTATGSSISLSFATPTPPKPTPQKVAAETPLAIPEAKPNAPVLEAAKPTTVQQQTIEKQEQQAELAAAAPIALPTAGLHHEPLISEPIFATPPKPPTYPKLARKRGLEGIVWLEIWLDDDGRQSKLDVIESSGVDMLDSAAIAAVTNWQFEPYRYNDSHIASRVRIPIEFALR